MCPEQGGGHFEEQTHPIWSSYMYLRSLWHLNHHQRERCQGFSPKIPYILITTSLHVALQKPVTCGFSFNMQ